MKSISIGIGPIAAASIYAPTQAASEGDFAQSLQNAVDMGSPSLGSKQWVQVRPAQSVQNTPKQSAQNTPEQLVQDVSQQFVQVIPEQFPQDIPEQSVQVIPGELVQDIPEQSVQFIPGQFEQDIPEQFEQEIPEQSVQFIPGQLAQDIPEQSLQTIPEQLPQAIPEQSAVQDESPHQVVDETQFEPQFLPKEPVHDPMFELGQTDDAAEKPVQPATATEPDSELMKELADLLGRLNSNEEMLTAPQRLRKTLENMIVQALSELSDPEKQEEEFTEMVLDFLMEFIDREFGGENRETSVFSDTKDKDDNVQDVLLQTVVQMLEDIRSENAQTDTSEDEKAVDGIPSDSMAKKPISTSASELLSEGTRQTVEPNSFAVPLVEETHIDVPAEEAVSSAEPPRVTEEKKTDEIPQVQPAEPEQHSELYHAALQTAERIFNTVTQPEKPAEQTVHTIRAYKGREISIISPVKPAEELQELTRIVNGGRSVKSEQPQLDLNSQQQTPTAPIKPAVKLETTGEAIPFEAAVARTVPQITLTRPIEGAHSGAQQIATQIASEIFNHLPSSGGATTFVMTLHPETLGKVTVKVVEEAGKISVSVTAHNKRTAELLSGRMDSLQTAMKENGTQLEKYQVVYAPEKDERPGQQQSFDGSSKNPYVKQDDEESDGDGEFAELLQNAV